MEALPIGKVTVDLDWVVNVLRALVDHGHKVCFGILTGIFLCIFLHHNLSGVAQLRHRYRGTISELSYPCSNRFAFFHLRSRYYVNLVSLVPLPSPLPTYNPRRESPLQLHLTLLMIAVSAIILVSC